jgi:hypothetical protein
VWGVPVILNTSKPLYVNGKYRPLSVKAFRDEIVSCATIKPDCQKCIWGKCCRIKKGEQE